MFSCNSKSKWHYFFSLFAKLNLMLRWAAIFFIIAIIAAIFGFTDIASGAAAMAKILFFIFVILFLLTLILGSSIFGKK